MDPYLTIDGGGTSTEGMLSEIIEEKPSVIYGRKLAGGVVGPGNIETMGRDPQKIRELFEQIREGIPPKYLVDGIEGVVACMAGCHSEEDQSLLIDILKEVFPEAKIFEAHEDTKAGYANAFGGGNGILIGAGTGASVIGFREGQFEKVSGIKGELLNGLCGSKGSAFGVAVKAVEEIQKSNTGESLGTSMLLQMLPQFRTKDQVAGLAWYVLHDARARKALAFGVIQEEVKSLAGMTETIIDRLNFPNPPIAMMSSMFKWRVYRHLLLRELLHRANHKEEKGRKGKKELIPARFFFSDGDGCVGALAYHFKKPVKIAGRNPKETIHRAPRNFRAFIATRTRNMCMPKTK